MVYELKLRNGIHYLYIQRMKLSNCIRVKQMQIDGTEQGNIIGAKWWNH